MFAWESRRSRRSGRDRRRPDLAAVVEALEGRQLLAYSSLGYGLPDLTVTGYGPTVASWGGQVAVTLNVQNLGVSSQLEPLSIAPGTPGSSDAAASTVTVFAARNAKSLAGAVPLGTVDIPAVAGNDAYQVTRSFTMPLQPAGFPGDGGTVYLRFVVNANQAIFESDRTNNISPPVPVSIQAPLPELAAVGLDVPPVMQPGDTIQPNIRVANLGPADTAPQGPVQVALVASTTPTFNSGSSIVAVYTVANIPAQSLAPSQRPVFGDANLTPPVNVVTISGAPVTLPTSPAVYYLGVVVDPANKIKQLQKVPQFTRPANPFSLSHPVGPPIKGLPPAGVDVAGGTALVPVFPNPFLNLPVGGLRNGSGLPPFPTQSISSIVQATTGNNVVTTSSVRAFGSRRAALAAMNSGNAGTPRTVATVITPSGAGLTSGVSKLRKQG